MKVKFCKNPLMFLMIAALFLAGCATELPTKTRRYVWPIPPDEPKIEWIKSYYGENDFPKSAFTGFMEILLGAPKPILFQKPIDIKSNNKGVIYVTDILHGGIFVFDTVNEKIEFWKQTKDPDGGLAITPYFIALDDNNNIYTVGTGRREIYVLDANGKLVRRIDFTGKVNNPGGIFVDSKGGRIYLVDQTDSKVEVFDLAGRELFSFGKLGGGDGEFNRPSAITINSKGEVIVGDTFNGRIQIFDHDGKYLRKFGQKGDDAASFSIIKGVAVDSDDNIYVTDGKANQFKVFNTQGQALIAIGKAYSLSLARKEAPGGFLLPQGIHIDKNDSIFIVDQANNRFQQFKYLKGSEPTDKVPAAGGIKTQ